MARWPMRASRYVFARRAATRSSRSSPEPIPRGPADPCAGMSWRGRGSRRRGRGLAGLRRPVPGPGACRRPPARQRGRHDPPVAPGRSLKGEGARVDLSLDEVDVVARGRVVDRFVKLEAELVKGDEAARMRSRPPWRTRWACARSRSTSWRRRWQRSDAGSPGWTRSPRWQRGRSPGARRPRARSLRRQMTRSATPASRRPNRAGPGGPRRARCRPPGRGQVAGRHGRRPRRRGRSQGHALPPGPDARLRGRHAFEAWMPKTCTRCASRPAASGQRGGSSARPSARTARGATGTGCARPRSGSGPSAISTSSSRRPTCIATTCHRPSSAPWSRCSTRGACIATMPGSCSCASSTRTTTGAGWTTTATSSGPRALVLPVGPVSRIASGTRRRHGSGPRTRGARLRGRPALGGRRNAP